jgi:gliding motility-associated protein GldM
MAGGVLTPRQKMINMMYLVLTALLAMNVSKEVLLAFRSIEVGIENSNEVVETKIDFLTETLKSQATENQKAVPLLAYAKEVSAESKSLIALITELKTTLLSDDYAGEDDEKPGEIKNLSDIDAGTRLLASKDSEVFRGQELQDKINNTKKKFLEIVGKVDKIKPSDIATLEQSFTLNANDFPKGERENTAWYFQFFHVPATGTMTMLTKLENDVLNTESIITEFLLNRVSATDFKFDKLRATVQAEKAYLPGGAEYEANIFLTASSSGIVAETFVGSLDWSLFKKDTAGAGEAFLPWNDVEAKMEGKSPFKGEPKNIKGGSYKSGTGIGQNSYQGAIKIANPVGGYDWYPFKGSYEGAAAGGFSASPTKMNVLYIGLDNPMSVTVGDAKPGTERVSLSGGSISKSGNEWIAKVTKQGETTLTASGMTPDGNPTKSFTAKFRVKRVPDPTPTLGGKLIGGNIKRGTLSAQTGIIALLKDFMFDARFNVTSYDFKLVSNGEIFPVRGNSGPSLSPKIKGLLKKARAKNIAIFEKIKVRGPDGTTRTLPSLTFTII